MFGKYNGFVSKARVSACMYFLVNKQYIHYGFSSMQLGQTNTSEFFKDFKFYSSLIVFETLTRTCFSKLQSNPGLPREFWGGKVNFKFWAPILPYIIGKNMQEYSRNFTHSIRAFAGHPLHILYIYCPLPLTRAPGKFAHLALTPPN
jgi:hypothetical protein